MLLLSGVASSQTLKGQSLFGPKPDLKLNAEGQTGSAVSTSKGVQVSVRAAGKNPWDAQLQTPLNTIAVKVGDVIFVSMTIASNDPSPASFSVHLQKVVPSYEYLSGSGFQALRSRKRVVMVWKSTKDIPVGQVELTMHLASKPQSIEFTDVEILNLGPDVDLKTLPVNQLVYGGEEADAPWRKQAEAMIEKHRKANLSVKVVDSKNRPITGAKVEIRMQKHAYPFGSFTDYSPGQTDEIGLKSRAVMEKMFNRVTVPIYWADWGWEDPKQRENYLSIINWATSKKFRMRAHTLLYPGYQFFPSRIAKLENNPEAFKKAIYDGTAERVRALRKFNFEAIDVVNELVTCTDVDRVAGPEVVQQMFKITEQNWPKAKRVYNDYDVFEAGQFGTSSSKKREEIYQRLNKEGIKVDQYGWQGHFSESLTAIPDVWKALDYFTKTYRKPIEITEFDIDSRDEVGQAAYTRDILTAWFAHPNTAGFTTWGFWEGSMWKPNGAMVRKDWTLKPNGVVWNELIFKKWWTNASLTTAKSGTAKTRGFRGTYRILVTHKGTKVEREVELNGITAEFIVKVAK